MNRIALLIGIDKYSTNPLQGCENDAINLATLLMRHYDDTPNFDCKLLVSSQRDITRADLKRETQDLFSKDVEVALFFFAGHGLYEKLGGYLVTQDAKAFDEGLSMNDIIEFANGSSARERIILLDCCHGGAVGNIPYMDNTVMLSEGVSILAASRSDEKASGTSEGGVFTSLICEGLSGGGADLVGKVTAASLYAYVDEVLTGWEQRPLFKAHVAKSVSIRNCAPAIDLSVLRNITSYFTDPEKEFQLDPSFEPEAEPKNEKNEKIFGHLQKFRAARLVEPVDEEHMFFAAINSKPCRLTPLGKYYWQRVKKDRI